MTIPVGTLLTFYEIDASLYGGERFYFHMGQNEFSGDVVWQGITYSAFPVEASGFEFKGDGSLPRPTIAFANVNQFVGKMARMFRDLVGCKLTRRQVFARYLDAINFVDGNPEADPESGFVPDIYTIDRKTYEDRNLIKFDLAPDLDLENVRVPARIVSGTVCPWLYKGAECGYTGEIVTCDKGLKTSNGCRVHFPAPAKLPYGGFPGVGRNRRR